MSTWHCYPIFVYGTLKRNEPNYGLIENPANGKSSFIGTAVTVKDWPLVIDTPFGIPFLLDQPGCGQKVHGELFRVDAAMLSKLDDLEDHPDVYTRTVIEVYSTDEQTNNIPSSITDENKTSNRTVIQCESYLLKNFNKAMLELPYIADYRSQNAPKRYVSARERTSPFKTHGIQLVKEPSCFFNEK